MNDLWTTDHKVLASIAEQIEDQGNDFADTDVIAELLGPDADRMDRSLRRLHNAEMIRAQPMLGGNWVISGVTERGLREVGAWPSEERYAQQLIAALEDVAENHPDPVQRSKARKMLDTIGEFGYKTFIDFSASLVAKMAGAV
jgi:sugar phosphate isomerase/epimerase